MLYNRQRQSLWLKVLVFTQEQIDAEKAASLKGFLLHTLNIKLQNPTSFLDPHYFMELLRTKYYGKFINTPYAQPLFTSLQQNQLDIYLEEHFSLLIILTFIRLNKETLSAEDLTSYKAHAHFLSFLKPSNIINKSPSKFFNSTVSNNTFSLLTYLGTVTTSITLQIN